MRGSSLQFAVVREDPLIELDVLEAFGLRHALLVASGGCTALTIRARRPDVTVEVLDPNPAQLEHLQAKLDALRTLTGAERERRFNVGTDDSDGLSECGNFESLFRVLRGFLHEFVVAQDRVAAFFRSPDERGPGAHESSASWFASAYWPVAFELLFSDAMLHAMFGPDATQHATPGSYPAYFRQALERGLARPDAHDNPFLQHILLGAYVDRPACRPAFLETAARASTPPFRCTRGPWTTSRTSAPTTSWTSRTSSTG